SRGYVQLRGDVLHVSSDRVLADHERGGDLAVALAACHEPQDLQLAGGQPVVRAGLRAPCERVNRRDVRQRTQFPEGTPSRLEVECEPILVAHRLTGPAHEDARAGGLVRRFELLPRPPGLTKTPQSGAG